ncbi:MAG: siderophore ferric iron reductase, partial [Vibrionaceae bacterium]|nr:siderophore ferric iron reductase [Vibrionaceae bacterium]
TDNDINPIIQDLYQQLSDAYPEAGRAYWLTRTWDLLCWQPVYVALISIYHFHSLPNLYAMAQSVKPCFVSGYRFEDESLFRGDHKTLISTAGAQIKALFDYYQNQMSEWIRIRPGFTHQLISDGILVGLMRLQRYFPQLTKAMIREHAVLWLQALDLDTDNALALYELSSAQSLKLVRKSCCLVYKCEGRKLCANCPRLAENRLLIHVNS